MGAPAPLDHEGECAMTHEIELKLRIAPQDAPRLRRHPAIMAASSGRPRTRKLLSIYYDTPDLQLMRNGISLRVRRMSGRWFQAVKSEGSATAGLHKRLEWEDMVASGQPDLTRILDPRLARFFANETMRAALQPIFRTEVSRTEWHLTFDDGDAVELALDLGRLVVGKRSHPISEIELELKSGHPGRLFDLALALQQDIPLHIEDVSKAQRGYALFQPSSPTIVKARVPKLSRTLDAEDAFRCIAWECIRQLQGNQSMVLYGADPEGVHQMRVALRRLRSAMAVFRKVIGRESRQEIAGEIAWLMTLLGAARDLDVLLGETLPPLLDQLDRPPSLVLLRDKAQSARHKAYAALRRALVEQRYQRLLLILGSWLENRRWRTADPQPHPLPVLELARQTLDKRHKRLKRHGRRLMHMHPEERHATRIAAKKLRYAAEFFSGLFDGGKARRFIARLSSLQDALGTLNDIAVTDRLVKTLIGRRPGQALEEATHLLSGWNACNAMHRLQSMDHAWNAFVRLDPFWD